MPPPVRGRASSAWQAYCMNSINRNESDDPHAWQHHAPFSASATPATPTAGALPPLAGSGAAGGASSADLPPGAQSPCMRCDAPTPGHLLCAGRAGSVLAPHDCSCCKACQPVGGCDRCGPSTDAEAPLGLGGAALSVAPVAPLSDTSPSDRRNSPAERAQHAYPCVRHGSPAQASSSSAHMRQRAASSSGTAISQESSTPAGAGGW